MKSKNQMKMNNHPIEGEDFVFVEHDAADFYSILLKNGPYSGVIYTYGKVTLKEENDQVRLGFTFKIEDTLECNYSKDDLEESDAFRNHIGDVLSEILSTSQFQIGNNNGVQSANDNLKELNS